MNPEPASTSRWSLACPAKLNWSLEVLGWRPDGFHELRSWFVALDWADRLSLHCAAAPDPNADVGALVGDPPEHSLSIHGPCAEGVPDDARNLVLRAEKQWRAAGGGSGALRWELHKNVPHGAGLGGGSSDAAAALALMQFSGEPLAAEALAEVALDLGSDVPFFLFGDGAELRGGRGEVVVARADPPVVWVVLVCPQVAANTAQVYATLQASPWTSGTAAEIPFPAQPTPNQLEQAAFTRVPELVDLADVLRGLAPFQMSGSGSAFFSACPDEPQAQALAEALGNRPELSAARVRVCAVRQGPVLGAPQAEPEASS